jgi:hypothetical protein
VKLKSSLAVFAGARKAQVFRLAVFYRINGIKFRIAISAKKEGTL